MTRERLRQVIPGLGTGGLGGGPGRFGLGKRTQIGHCLSWVPQGKTLRQGLGVCVLFGKCRNTGKGMGRGHRGRKAAGKGRVPSQLPLWGTGLHAVETLWSIVYTWTFQWCHPMGEESGAFVCQLPPVID